MSIGDIPFGDYFKHRFVPDLVEFTKDNSASHLLARCLINPAFVAAVEQVRGGRVQIHLNGYAITVQEDYDEVIRRLGVPDTSCAKETDE